MSSSYLFFFFFSSRRRHTRFKCDWSSDVCSPDLGARSGSALAKALQSQIELPPDEMPCGKLLAPDILVLRRDPQGLQQPVLQQLPERQMQGYADRGLAPGLRQCGLQVLQPHRDAPGNAGSPGQI